MTREGISATLPQAPDGRLMMQRFGALVAHESHSVHRFSGNPDATAAHNEVFDLVTRFAREDAKGKPIHTLRRELEMGVPIMLLANFPLPADFGLPGGQGLRPDLAIFVHGDIAEAHNPEQHTLTIDGDMAIGRGTADMKHAFLSGIAAVTHAPENSRVVLVGYPDEELGNSPTMYKLIEAGLDPIIALQFDGEPIPEGGSNISFVSASKAMMRFRVGLPDDQPLPTSHPSRPHLAESALEDRVVPFLQQIRRPLSRGGVGIPHRRTRSPRATTLVAKVDQGDRDPTTTNSHIGLHMDMRGVSTEQLREDHARVSKAALDNGLVASEPYSLCPEYEQSHRVPEVVLYRLLGSGVMGRSMDLRTDTGGNDLGKLPEGPVTILSGIRGGDFHGPNEWVSITAMLQAAQLQAAYAQHLPQVLNRQNGYR